MIRWFGRACLVVLALFVSACVSCWADDAPCIGPVPDPEVPVLIAAEDTLCWPEYPPADCDPVAFDCTPLGYRMYSSFDGGSTWGVIETFPLEYPAIPDAPPSRRTRFVPVRYADLTTGTVVRYRITAFGEFGESTPSNVVTVSWPWVVDPTTIGG